ncbi:MAG: FAD-dependent oxidoreductase [Desulfohalobiaceae bacterium]|nr:FAD-dependent oxidoreductase [Desulfohalobiaceae bacterium]
MQNASQVVRIAGQENGRRLETRVLEEKIQEAVARGYRKLEVQALGQHGIGGRLWTAGEDPVSIVVKGPSGQRLGSMGFANTVIEAMGNASEDVGWLNAGAEIVVHGHAGNGVANAMAQGRISIAGNIGARGMTMTKHNPRFGPPEMWVLGSAGDYFAEFMAGGTAVVCGHEAQNLESILGYRACVGMVGGRIFVRGNPTGFSQTDSKQMVLLDEDWAWLLKNLELFLERINEPELLSRLSIREDWHLLVSRTPQEKKRVPMRNLWDFQEKIWEKELGSGGLIGDLADFDRSQVPLIVSGELRRFVPLWENRKYLPPCEAGCPTGIPVHERWRLIREGRIDEALDLALEYTPLPATVCGHLCPNICMQSCTRQSQEIAGLDVSLLGQASLRAKLPAVPEISGKRIGVIGGGPAGLSVAWQLRLKGHETVIYDRQEVLGGKISSVIPESRIPAEVLKAELERIRTVLPHVTLGRELTREDLTRLKEEYDFLVLATGAQAARVLPVPGKERLVPALEFLKKSRQDTFEPGRKVVIIGAGNVGCDAAAEAHRLGSEEITLIDIQEPASFGKEREAAEAVGARFRWPVFTKEITEEGVVLTTGELLPADLVLVSVGDQPEADFFPKSIKADRGYVSVDQDFRTTDKKFFAIGDAVRPGLLTESIAAGLKVAEVIDSLGKPGAQRQEIRPTMDKSRIKLEYFDPRVLGFETLEECAGECASCGSCRDCGTCIAVCPQSAISRVKQGTGFELIVDSDRCIGCGFCAGICPCGVWNLVENEPLSNY